MSNGKGSSRRPRQVPRSQYDANWEAVFGKKKQLDSSINHGAIKQLIVSASEVEELQGFLGEVARIEQRERDQQTKQLPLPLKERK